MNYVQKLEKLGFNLVRRAIEDRDSEDFPGKITEWYMNSEARLMVVARSGRVLAMKEFHTRWGIEDLDTRNPLGSGLDFPTVVRCLERSLDLEVFSVPVQ